MNEPFHQLNNRRNKHFSLIYLKFVLSLFEKSGPRINIVSLLLDAVQADIHNADDKIMDNRIFFI